MTNNKKLIIIIIVLLILDAFLCAFVLQTAKFNRQTDQLIPRMKNAIQYAYTSFYQYSPQTLVLVLNDYQTASILTKDNDCFLFIPKDYCDACLSYQLQLIKEFFSASHKSLCIIAPDKLKKVITSVLSNSVSLDLVTYDAELPTIDSSLYNESIAFFQVSGHEVRNIFIVNKLYGDATAIYFNALLTT